MSPLHVVNGEVLCPRKGLSRIARDVCCAEQAKLGHGCRIGCARGAAALREKEAFDREEAREEHVRELVRERHAAYYARYGKLPSQQKPRTGRPRGRPRKPRAPVLPTGSEWWR